MNHVQFYEIEFPAKKATRLQTLTPQSSTGRNNACASYRVGKYRKRISSTLNREAWVVMVNVAFNRPARSSSGTPSTRMPISYSWSTIQNPCSFTRSNSASSCNRPVYV